MSEPAESQQPEPQRAPLPRIGDADRDRAVDALQVHMAQGRLDREEFDERLSRALVARTAADLQPLFVDLPDPRPSTDLAPLPPSPLPWSQGTPVASSTPAVVPDASVPATRPKPLGATLVLTLVWPAAVLFCLATSWANWWVFIVAAMVAGVVNKTWPSDDGGAPTPEGQERRDRG